MCAASLRETYHVLFSCFFTCCQLMKRSPGFCFCKIPLFSTDLNALPRATYIAISAYYKSNLSIKNENEILDIFAQNPLQFPKKCANLL